MSLKEEAKTIACIIIVLLPSLSTLVFADGPSTPGTAAYLEINGAKIVSEGGYFWFNITNKGDYWIEVALHYSSDFIMFRFNISKLVHGMGESFGDGFYSFPLESNDTWIIGFVVPMLPVNLSYNSYLFTFYSAVGGLSTEKAIDISYYDVLVIKGIINVKVDDSKLNQLLSLYSELSSKLNQLLLLYNDSSSKLETLQNIGWGDYVQGFLLGLVFGLLIMTYIEVKRIERALRKIEDTRSKEK